MPQQFVCITTLKTIELLYYIINVIILHFNSLIRVRESIGPKITKYNINIYIYMPI